MEHLTFFMVGFAAAFLLVRFTPVLEDVKRGDSPSNSVDLRDYFTSTIQESDYHMMIWILFPLEYCGKCWLEDDKVVDMIYQLPDRKIGIGLIVSPKHTYNIRTLVHHDVAIEREVDPRLGGNTYYVYADNEGNVLHVFESSNDNFDEGVSNIRMIYALAKLQGFDESTQSAR